MEVSALYLLGSCLACYGPVNPCNSIEWIDVLCLSNDTVLSPFCIRDCRFALLFVGVNTELYYQVPFPHLFPFLVPLLLLSFQDFLGSFGVDVFLASTYEASGPADLLARVGFPVCLETSITFAHTAHMFVRCCMPQVG